MSSEGGGSSTSRGKRHEKHRSRKVPTSAATSATSSADHGSEASSPSPRLTTSPSLSDLSAFSDDVSVADTEGTGDDFGDYDEEEDDAGAAADEEMAGDIDDEDEEEEENMTVEERLEAEREQVAQCKETITSLIEQITAYRRIVEEEKERDKKKLSQMAEALERQRQLAAELEARAEQTAGDEALQQKVRQLTRELEEEKGRTAELRVQTVANLKALQADLLNIDATNKELNRELAEERAAHKQTIQQLWAFKQRAESPALAVQDQEVRLRITIDGNRITQAVLIPENDEARAALKEENDFLRGKFLDLQQQLLVMRSECEEAKKNAADAEKLAAQLAELKAQHEATAAQLEEATKARDALQQQNETLQQRFNARLKSDEAVRASSVAAALHKEATRIFDRYCIDNAPYEIDLTKQTKHKIFAAINSGETLTTALFDQARQEVVQLLESDIYLRWLATNTFQQAWLKPEKPKFAEMFASHRLRKDFQKFCEHEMAVENMLFIIDVEDYSQITPDRSVSPSVERRHRSHRAHRPRSVSSANLLEPDSARRKQPEPSTSRLSVQVPVTTAPPSPEPQATLAAPAATTAAAPVMATPTRPHPAVPPLIVKPAGPVVRVAQQPVAVPVPSTSPPLPRSIDAAAAAASDFGSDEPGTSSSAKRRSPSPVPVASTEKKLSVSAHELSVTAQPVPSAQASEPRRSAELHRTISDGRKTIRKQARFSVMLDPAELRALAAGASTPPVLAAAAGIQPETPAKPPTSATDETAPTPISQIFARPPPEQQPKSTAAVAAAAAMAVARTSPARTSASALLPPPASTGNAMRDQYLQNLHQLVSEPEPEAAIPQSRRLEMSFVVTGAVSYILPIRSHVWIANGSSPCSIQIYDRENCNLKKEISIGASVTQMLLVDRLVWTSTTDKSLLCFDTRDLKVPRQLNGHTRGPVFCLERAGRYVWSIAADQNIGIWDPKDMKLRKMINSGSYMTCMLSVNGVMWVGTSLGIQFYDQTNFKPIKMAAPKTPEKESSEPSSSAAAAAAAASSSSAPKPFKMSVSKLLLVDNEVWAVHHDDNLISIWSIETKSVVATIEAKRVRDLIRLGSLVWTCSWDNTIRCWDIVTRQFVRELSGIHDDTITTLAIANSKACLRVWSGSADHTVCVWNTEYQGHTMVAHAGSKTGICPVCNKSLRGIGQKVVVCQSCLTYTVHRQCADGIPTNAICTEATAAAAAAAADGSLTGRPRKDTGSTGSSSLTPSSSMSSIPPL